MNILKVVLFVVLSSLCNCVLAQSTLRFIVNEPGSAPYLYRAKNSDKYLGIIPDILKGLIDNNKLSIKYIPNNRKRSEEYMYQKKADLMMLSKAWLRQPDKLIVTISILQHHSFLYQREKFSAQFSLDKLTNTQIICTRRGYSYPNLKRYFNNNKLVRLDSSSHVAMLKMLFKKRCALVIMNNYNAESLLNSNEFKNQPLFRSQKPISTVPLNIILRPELTQVKKQLDTHIKQLQQSGKLNEIIKFHITNNQNNYDNRYSAK